MQPKRRGRRRLEKIPFVQRSDLGTYDARSAAIVQKMHKRVDRVESVCAAALVERGQKGTGNAGERAVRKRERQRGVKDELTFFTAYARDAAAAIRELGGEKSVAKRFEKLFAKALGIVDRSGEKRVDRAAGADGTRAVFAGEAAHTAAGIAALGSAEQGGGESLFACGVALKREGEVRFLIGQQRAVKGDAVFFKKRAELLDAALVRVALPGAAAEQQEEQKRVDEQQNDDDDIFEPRGFHVRASFPERSVGKPADADGVRAVLVVEDVQLGAQILAVRDGRGLPDGQQQCGRIAERIAAAVEGKFRDGLVFDRDRGGVAAVGKAQRRTADRIVKAHGEALVAAVDLAEIELGVAAYVAKQREGEALRARDGFEHRGLSGRGGGDIVDRARLGLVRALIEDAAVGLKAQRAVDLFDNGAAGGVGVAAFRVGVELRKAQKCRLIGEGIARRERVALRRFAENERVGRELRELAGERERKICAVAIERGERFAQCRAAYLRPADKKALIGVL